MTNVEGWLLSRMTVRRWLVTFTGSMLLIGGVAFWIGWRAGERHVANEIASAVQNAFGQVGQSITEAFPPPTPEEIAAEKKSNEDFKATIAQMKAADQLEHKIWEKQQEQLRKIPGK